MIVSFLSVKPVKDEELWLQNLSQKIHPKEERFDYFYDLNVISTNNIIFSSIWMKAKDVCMAYFVSMTITLIWIWSIKIWIINKPELIKYIIFECLTSSMYIKFDKQKVLQNKEIFFDYDTNIR